MKRCVPAFALVLACSPLPHPPPPATTEGTSTATLPTTRLPNVPDPAPPPAPIYDLAADLEARRQEIVALFSPSGRFEIVEEVFLIASPSGSVAGAANVSKRAIAAYYNERFTRKPDRAITVLLFDRAKPYDAWCRAHGGEPCTTPYGFYEPGSRTIVMNIGPGVGTLTHELVHPIVEADWPQAPDWIDEGIASLYEAFSLPRPGEIRGHTNFRLPRLKSALASKNERIHATLPVLFGMRDAEFRGPREDLNYALARYFCLWMEQQKKLWPFYRAWRDGFAQDPSGERAFVAVMGETPTDADRRFAQWVRAL
jgi:hypothetical protein